MKISFHLLCLALALAGAFVVGSADAQTKQSFTATVDGKAWESDHDGITVVPVTLGSGTLTVLAVTKGFSGLKPATGFSDQFSIACPLPKQAIRFDAGVASKKSCAISFTKARRNVTHADFKTKRNEGEFESSGTPNGFVNFTRVAGKTIEGSFSAELTDPKTKQKLKVEGRFVGLDEQVGSKGIN